MTVLNEFQEERLKDITANLRQIRQEKSISLEQIAMQTHIRLAFLQALEEWRFEELPEPIFVQGFIRRYADKLGLDGAALADSFEVHIVPLENHNSNKQLSLYIPLFVPYIFLLIIASVGLFYVIKSEFTGKSLANKQNSILSSPQQTALSPTKTSTSSKITDKSPTTRQNTILNVPQKNAPSPTTKPEIDVVVSLELTGNSWLQIKADGKTEFEGTLTTGKRKKWTAKKYLTIRSGNAGAVLVSVNEQESKLLGNEGQVKEITYESQ
ncbi:helix-turn-helix domain-containing protein [Anabaena sp. UHCC 0451]|uniref:helix-turn-helix domain-containing protein n=1 Tax=Anabaena sp. UHCC 0451 TaxID=2055235 RepID=UPI003A4C6CEB